MYRLNTWQVERNHSHACQHIYRSFFLYVVRLSHLFLAYTRCLFGDTEIKYFRVNTIVLDNLDLLQHCIAKKCLVIHAYELMYSDFQFVGALDNDSLNL